MEDADAATCAEVGVQDADAVLEDGGGATPFMRSRISFISRNFSSILDIEAQRSSISTMAQFDLEEKNWVDSDGTRDFGKNLGDSEEQALITNCYGPRPPNHNNKNTWVIWVQFWRRIGEIG